MYTAVVEEDIKCFVVDNLSNITALFETNAIVHLTLQKHLHVPKFITLSVDFEL